MATVSEHSTSWFDECWPRLTVASGIGYLATAYGISRWLTRRSPAILAAPQEFAELRIETMTCRTQDGYRLKGWVIEPPDAHSTIAIFHGLRANRSQALSRIAFLTIAGYRCVAFDHRAHGESDGPWTSFGYFERYDVEAVAEVVRSRWSEQPRAALGISMGAAAVCFAGEKSRGAFDAVILESMYHDLAATFQHRIGCDYPHWFKHFRSGVIWLTERRFGVRVEQVSPLAHIANLAPRPVLLLTGSDDPHARPDEVQLLANQLPDTSEFHIIPDVGHENVCELAGPPYRELILSFLEKHLNRQPVVAAAK